MDGAGALRQGPTRRTAPARTTVLAPTGANRLFTSASSMDVSESAQTIRIFVTQTSPFGTADFTCIHAPLGQDAASQEGVELVFDEVRQVRAGSIFGLGEEVRGVLLHQAVQRALFRAVLLVVNRCAIRRPLGLRADRLHTKLPKW